MTRISRRHLLAAASVAGAASIAGCTPGRVAPTPMPTADPAVLAPTTMDAMSWASVKSQFVDAPGYARFGAFVFSAHPAPVRAAVARHRAGMDDDPLAYLRDHEVDLESAVAAGAAAYLGRPADEIAFTDSTTMGLGLLYGGLALAPGDEVLSTTHDFYSTYEALRLRAVRDGVTVRRVALYDDPATASAGVIVARLAAAIRPRTRVVAVTWVHSGTGVKLPIRAVADMLAGVNAARPPAARVLLCVDGVHGFGIEGTTPDELGCDFLVSGTHKWLFGPRGTGLVWGRPAAWARMRATIPTFADDAFPPWWEGRVADLPPGSAYTPGGYHAFEHRWAVADAFAMHAAIGPDRIAARTHDLATGLKDALVAVPGIEVVTPRAPEMSAGIVCVRVPGRVGEVVSALRERKIITSITPYATAYLRLGPSLATDEHDIEAAVAALRASV